MPTAGLTEPAGHLWTEAVGARSGMMLALTGSDVLAFGPGGQAGPQADARRDFETSELR